MKTTQKNCKVCGEDFRQTITLNPTCSATCYDTYLKKKAKEKEERRKLKADTWQRVNEMGVRIHKAVLKKNTKRAFSDPVRKEVMERDNGCILCRDNRTMDLHHVKYGLEAEYTPDRNDANKLVWLCKEHHHELHFGTNNTFRQQCKDYLAQKYPNA